MPLFTIITPTLNGGRALDACLTSVCAQTVPREHLVVDGGSGDGTPGRLAAWQRTPVPGDYAFRFLSEPDHGLYDAINKGLALATGEVIGILHADDEYASPIVLERVAAALRDPAVPACYGDLLYVGPRPAGPAPRGRPILRRWHAGPYDARRLYWGWMPPHPALFIRRSVYARLGGYRTDLGTAADYELILRYLGRHGLRPAYVPEVLVHMQAGGVSNRSLANRWRAHRMDRRAWRLNELRPYPWTLCCKPLRKLPQWLPCLLRSRLPPLPRSPL